MSERLERIYKLFKNHKSRASYIKAKLVVLVPAQIRALRLKSVNPAMPRQIDLAREADVHQSRISMFETPGAANITLETLAKIAAGLRVGVIVKFVPFHEMLRWENSFSPDDFNVLPRLENDEEFINPVVEHADNVQLIAESAAAPSNTQAISSVAQDQPKAECTRKPMSTASIAQSEEAAASAAAGA